LSWVIHTRLPERGRNLPQDTWVPREGTENPYPPSSLKQWRMRGIDNAKVGRVLSPRVPAGLGNEGKEAMAFRSILVVLLLFETVSSVPAQIILGERSITLTFVNPQDLSPVNWTSHKVTLVSVPTSITSDNTVYTLLQANAIVPDSEAFTLLYDLNPSLRDIKTLTEGASLQLPKIAGGAELRQLQEKQYLAKLTVDPEIRGRMNASIENLQLVVTSANRVSSPGTEKQLETLAKWYAQIEKSYRRRTGPPLRRETLLQLNSEVAVLNSLLQTALQSKRKLSNDDEAQVGAIYQDLEMVMRAYGQVLANEAPKAEEQCEVTVNIRGDAPSAIGALRVYYTFNGLYREPPLDPPVTSTGFAQLGSGQNARLLAEKNYKIWAASDGDPGHPLTPPLKLKTPASACGPTAVDLSLVLRKH
jgi:hypothetical protein